MSTTHIKATKELTAWTKTLPKDIIAKVSDRSDELANFTQAGAEVYELASIAADRVTAQLALAEFIAQIYLLGYTDGQGTNLFVATIKETHDCASCPLSEFCPLPQAEKYREGSK